MVSKWGEIIMDDAQYGENIKAWGCAIIVNGTKEINLKWLANINRAFDLCRVSNFIKTDVCATLAQNYYCHWIYHPWPKRWQVPILIGVKFHRRQESQKLLSLLNSPASLCVEYEISLKLKHLLFFIQNYGLKDDRCKHWQVSRITENYCDQWIWHLQIVH